MGGCCAPGKLNTPGVSTTMKERRGEEDVDNGCFVAAGENEKDGVYGGAHAEEPKQLQDTFKTLNSKNTSAKANTNEAANTNMEELLQVLESAVEKEFLTLKSGHANIKSVAITSTGDQTNGYGDGDVDVDDDGGEDNMGYYGGEYGETNENQIHEISESHYSSAVTPVSSLHSGASSFKGTKSPGGSSSPLGGDWCSNVQKELVSGVSSKVSARAASRATGLDWGDRVEATLESLHDMKGEKENPPSSVSNANNLTAGSSDVIDKHFGDLDQILHQMMTVDSPAGNSSGSRSSAAASSCPPRPPETLTEFDDYPRGSSDTNSEEAERERKDSSYRNETYSSPCSTSGFRVGLRQRVASQRVANHDQFENHALAAAPAPLESARECQEDVVAPIANGSSAAAASSFGDEYTRLTGAGRAGTSCSPRIVASRPSEARNGISLNLGTVEEFEERVQDCSNGGSPPVSVRGADSYRKWLEKHSQEYGRKNETFQHGIRDIPGAAGEPDELSCKNYIAAAAIDDDAALAGRQTEAAGERHERATESTCSSSSTSSKPCNELQKLHTSSSCFLFQRSEQQARACLRASEASEQLGSMENSTSRPALPRLNTPRFALGKACNAPLRIQEDWDEENCGKWEQKDFGRPYGFMVAAAPATGNSVACKSLLSPGQQQQQQQQRFEFAMCSTGVSNRSQVDALPPSRGSSGDSRCSKANSKHGTPKSVLSGRHALATPPNSRQKVQVCVRMRPFNDHEKVCPLRQLLCVMGTKVIVKEYDRPTVRRSMDSGGHGDLETLEFRVDCVVDDSYLQKHSAAKLEESQRRMYESIGLPCLEYALDGYNTTILAYGQVGTGKSHTMMGDGTAEASGLIPRLGKDLMHQLNKEYRGEFEVQVSYLEIYQERIRDLLADRTTDLQGTRCGSVRNSSSSGGWCDYNSDASTCDESATAADFDTASSASLYVGTPRGTGSWRPERERIRSVYFDPVPKRDFLKVREHPVTGPYVEGLQWRDVATGEELEAIILQGAANRTFAATACNKLSSRSHTLLTIKLIRGGRRFIHGCPTSSFNLINLVDLAGTEKPQVTRRTSLERQEETRYINRSLAQLNDVILNLSRGKFVSFRGSALTWLLRDSLCKDSKLLLVATISPAEQDFQESVNTLRYASRANRIHSCGVATSHPDQKKQLFVSMRKEIQVLHNLVHDLTKNKNSSSNSNNNNLASAGRPSAEIRRRSSRISYTT